MDERIRKYIQDHQEEMIATLMELIETPSPDGGDTEAQVLVKRKLEKLGMETEMFRMDERVKGLPDYCEPDIAYTEGTYNLAGVKKGKKDHPSLLLFAHIDTEREDFFGTFEDPYQAERRDGKIYGLGASDDKGGIGMMLEAVKAAMALEGDLGYDLTVLSLLGKHGGAFGTLSAMVKGCHGDCSLYLHPAETGHGFQEIKNISLGILDLKLTVFGKPGIPHDDLSTGENANLKMAEAVRILEEFNQTKRKEEVFDFGFFKGEPSFLLNIGSISSPGTPGNIALKTECLFRCRFFFPMSLDSLYEELSSFLLERLEGDWTLEKGYFRAEPAMSPSDHPFLELVKDSIRDVTGEGNFIQQYHGGSDVRFPILYGNSVCAGIGPYSALPLKGSGEREWIDEKDYLNGIAILTEILLKYKKAVC